MMWLAGVSQIGCGKVCYWLSGKFQVVPRFVNGHFVNMVPAWVHV